MSHCACCTERPSKERCAESLLGRWVQQGQARHLANLWPTSMPALQGASTNLHESIRCGTLFPAWKERLELKLGGKPVQLRYALQQHGAHRSGSGEATWMALETQRDFDTLRRHYAHSLAHRANNPGKTLRMLVFADEACTSNRATASASQAPEASSSPAVFAESQQQHTPSATSRRPPQHPHLKNFRCPPAALQPSRKMRRRRMSAE